MGLPVSLLPECLSRARCEYLAGNSRGELPETSRNGPGDPLNSLGERPADLTLDVDVLVNAARRRRTEAKATMARPVFRSGLAGRS